jgi:hypothetical protein
MKVEQIGEGAFGVASRVVISGAHQGILQDQTGEVRASSSKSQSHSPPFELQSLPIAASLR